jgi:hypothetical protein
MAKYLRISSYIKKPFLTNDFAIDSVSISLYMSKISFSFQCVFVALSDPLAVAGSILPVLADECGPFDQRRYQQLGFIKVFYSPGIKFLTAMQ